MRVRGRPVPKVLRARPLNGNLQSQRSKIWCNVLTFGAPTLTSHIQLFPEREGLGVLTRGRRGFLLSQPTIRLLSISVYFANVSFFGLFLIFFAF
jgi:hypothetical protein